MDVKSFTAPAPKPKSLLGYHRILSPTAGVRVSPLCLGAMNFGDKWSGFMGDCNREQSFAMLDTFFGLGGNFIDTANNYQEEQSEEWLGQWMEERDNRDQIIIATKYTTGYRNSKRDAEPLQSNFTGNSAKSMHVSVSRSLKKLKTDYIDILYVHWWDFTSSVEEVMRNLNNLVVSGKVLYLGISDTPAWVVVKANDYARTHGLCPFSVYQGLWSAAVRDMERDIIPMCVDQGMAIAPWGALGRGNFRSAEARKQAKQGGRQAAPMSDTEVNISDALDKIADTKSSTVTGVAMAYVMHKTPNVFPIIGGRKTEHLKSNIEALSIRLSPEDIDAIEAASSFDPGFPTSFLMRGTKYDLRASVTDSMLAKTTAHVDIAPKQKPVEPRVEV